MHHTRTLLLLLLLAPSLYAAAPEDSTTTNANRTWVESQVAAADTNSTDVLARPGLIADRRTREIRLWAEATGIGTNNPIEFVLIGEGSGHAYEAIAISLAKPSAVDEALRFVGMTPGQGPTPDTFAFWPKGERVALTVVAVADDDWTEPIPAEHLLWDDRAHQPATANGFVYIDAGTFTPEGSNAAPAFIADEYDPRAIAATYNEPHTVLDIPSIAAQGSVYGTRVANPARVPRDGQLLEFRLRPEKPAGATRVRDMRLDVCAVTHAARPADARFSLVDAGAAPAAEPWPRAELEQRVAALVAEGIDPFVRVRFDEALRLDEAQAAAKILDALEREDGVRADAPGPGELFYRTFAPDERNRRREDRIGQPWELHLRRESNALLATAIQLEERWHDDQLEPEIVATDHPLDTPDQLKPLLAATPGLPVILIFAPGDATVGDVMRYVLPTLATHRLIHVYLEPKPDR